MLVRDAAGDVVAIFATRVLLQEYREEVGDGLATKVILKCKFCNMGLVAGTWAGWGRRRVGRSSIGAGGKVVCFCNSAFVAGINEGACEARALHQTANSAGIQRPSMRRIF